MEQKKDEQGVQTRNILIVDDDPDTCQLLASLFRVKGYHTTVVYSGPEAVNCVQQGEPDIVILDIMMPHMDGWETYQRMRNYSEVPVLFLTALASGENAARAMKVGASDYIRKPFHPKELLARVETVLNNPRSRPGYANMRLANRYSLWRPTVSVIIPTLNEAENLPLVLPNLPMDWIDEVILVDGRSIDGTAEIARKLMPSIKIIMERRLGKGVALRSGFAAAKGDIVVALDADGSTDPAEIPAFIGALLAGADFVKGSRFIQGGGTDDMPRYRRLGNAALVQAANLLFRMRYTDITYGFNATWRCHTHTLALEFDGWPCEIITNIRARRNGLRVVEVACHEHERIFGDAKLRAFSAGWEILQAMLMERFRINDSVAFERTDQATGIIDLKTKDILSEDGDNQ